MTLIKRNKLETVDYHLIGNINALLRIPFTTHEKTKNPCLTLRKNNSFSITVEELCKKLDVKEYRYEIPNNFVGSEESIHPYPCLEYFIRVPNPLNYCRVAFAIYRLKQGKSTHAIFGELFNFKWNDWNDRKTLYHLKKIASRGYSMPTCKTLKEHGLCLGDECKYSDDRVYKFIKNVEEVNI
jgi:hypothetical protein